MYNIQTKIWPLKLLFPQQMFGVPAAVGPVPGLRKASILVEKL